jgi:hypothetical protein
MIAELIEQLRAKFSTPAADVTASDVRADDVDLTDPGARIANWLPYSAYMRDEQIYVNRDSLGFVLEVTPQTGADESTAERLKGLYARLPTDSTLQIHMWASPNIDPILRDHANLRSPCNTVAAQRATATTFGRWRASALRTCAAAQNKPWPATSRSWCATFRFLCRSRFRAASKTSTALINCWRSAMA